MFSRNRNSPHKCHLSMERLEDRQMMAGNIKAEVLFGDTLVLSEASGHQGLGQAVQVSQVNGRIRVDGLVSLTGGQTKINGATRVEFALPKNLSINLGGGIDQVAVRNISLQNISISTAAPSSTTSNDNDIVVVSGVSLTRNLNISTGRGQDSAQVTFSRIGNGAADTGNLNVFTGVAQAFGESDKDGFVVHDCTIRGKTHIETGASTDVVIVQNSSLGDAATDATEIFTGAGADFVHFGPQGAQVGVPVFVAGNLDIRTLASLTSTSDADVDSVTLLDTTVRENIYVKLGAGNDQVNMENVTAFKTILLEGQGGNDTMKLVQVEAADGLFALLGSGDDVLDLTGLRASKMGITGSDGFDRLFRFDSSNIPPANVFISGIEEINGIRQNIKFTPTLSAFG